MTVEFGVECPCCGAVSQTIYRCDSCKKDLVGETADSQGGERHV